MYAGAGLVRLARLVGSILKNRTDDLWVKTVRPLGENNTTASKLAKRLLVPDFRILFIL